MENYIILQRKAYFDFICLFYSLNITTLQPCAPQGAQWLSFVSNHSCLRKTRSSLIFTEPLLGFRC